MSLNKEKTFEEELNKILKGLVFKSYLTAALIEIQSGEVVRLPQNDSPHYLYSLGLGLLVGGILSGISYWNMYKSYNQSNEVPQEEDELEG